MAERKSKLIKKYLGQTKTKKHKYNRQGLMIRDQEELELDSSVSSQSESEDDRGRRRVADSSEDEEVKPRVKLEQEPKKSKTVSKGIRKALGLKKGEDIDQFVNALQIQGIDMKAIESYLKHNKEGITMDTGHEKKQKKKKQRKRIRDQSQSDKPQSEDSDLVIPEHARTIYRDKQGQIKQYSVEQEKQMKKQQVMNRLAQWQKGMKKDQVESNDQKPNVWDDPLRRWATPAQKNPLKCPYQGYANRFNIRPGFRWDGVIRGNGFENKALQQTNLRKLKQEQQQRQYMKNL